MRHIARYRPTRSQLARAGERMGDTSKGYEDLRRALDGLDPEGFEVLDDDDLRFLAQRVRQTLERHQELLDRETEESLRYVPRLVRPAVKKIVGL